MPDMRIIVSNPKRKDPNLKPRMEPRQRRDGSGWFVFVWWGDMPAEQVGGFSTEEEAKDWIEHRSAGWLKAEGEGGLE